MSRPPGKSPTKLRPDRSSRGQVIGRRLNPGSVSPLSIAQISVDGLAESTIAGSSVDRVQHQEGWGPVAVGALKRLPHGRDGKQELKQVHQHKGPGEQKPPRGSEQTALSQGQAHNRYNRRTIQEKGKEVAQSSEEQTIEILGKRLSQVGREVAPEVNPRGIDVDAKRRTSSTCRASV